MKGHAVEAGRAGARDLGAEAPRPFDDLVVVRLGQVPVDELGMVVAKLRAAGWPAEENPA
uniref:hypothetical protein n=1 Tax=uncultured Caulobacter sp. TaxID=158749 RepID=UPI0025F31D10|nr:hypothetical protein [uncultured Caulobacter sp.]